MVGYRLSEKAIGDLDRLYEFGIVRMERELVELFGRRVDLVTRPVVENSRNPIRRQAILEDARVIYAA